MSYRKHLMSNDISPSEMYAATAVDSDTDTISRQAALDIFDDYNVAVENGQIEAYSRDRKRLCDLPPAEPAPDQNGDLWINVPDIDKVTRIYVQESKSKFCRIFYEER